MSWSSDKYLAKARGYWAKATAIERDSPEFLLHVAYVCEFLVRGCFVEINPALNAAGDEESLIFSAGGAATRAPKTIDLTGALGRLLRFYPEISDSEQKAIVALIAARNAELHSDEDALVLGQANELMPLLYSSFVRLIEQSGRKLEEVFGPDDAAHAKRTADAIAKDRKKRISDLIRIQKDRFFSLPEQEQAKQREAAKLGFVSAVLKSGHHVLSYKCPACAQLGMLAGSPTSRSAPILKGDAIFQEVRISPEIFECKCCELSIKGLDELMSAGFPHETQTVDEVDIMEHFNLDPMDYVNTDEIIREYNDEMAADQYQYR